jgi:hypothetical protein
MLSDEASALRRDTRQRATLKAAVMAHERAVTNAALAQEQRDRSRDGAQRAQEMIDRLLAK